MVYDKALEKRIERIVASWAGVSRRAMFGGICRLVRGNMYAGVLKNLLILRLGETGVAEALAGSYAKPFDITGRPMKGRSLPETFGVLRGR